MSSNNTTQRVPRNGNSQPRHRGQVLLAAVVMIPVLISIISLAVDLGRMQLAKAELQSAADAAARWAAKGIQDGTAVAKAKAAAAANTVAGQSLVLTDADIVQGNWDSTKSPAFDSTRTPVNAVQITARRTAARQTQIPLYFASIIGVASGELAATAIAQIQTGTSCGFVSLDGVIVKNNLVAAHYSSSNFTNPSSSKNSGNGVIASNGAITAKHNEDVGSLILGPSGSHNLTLPSAATYLLANVPTPTVDFSAAPAINPGGIGSDLTVSGNVTLLAGTYYFTSVEINNNGKLTFSGPSTVYVDGNITYSNHGEISAFNDVPGNLSIIQRGAGTTFGGSGANSVTLIGNLVAPQTSFIAKNNGVIKGGAIVKSIESKNNLELYYDTTLGSTVETGTADGGAVTTVR